MNEPRRQLAGAALIGRRIGIAAFWALAMFVVVASTRSVVMELYGKPSGAGDRGQCTSQLRSLHASLLEHASTEVRHGSDSEGGHISRSKQPWLKDWDQRFAGTREPCAGMWEARETLQTLRKKLETMLRDYARDEQPLTDRIERALSQNVPSARNARDVFALGPSPAATCGTQRTPGEACAPPPPSPSLREPTSHDHELIDRR